MKVTLRLRGNGDVLQVDASREEIDALGVAAGDLVVVDVRSARVFLGDYTI